MFDGALSALFGICFFDIGIKAVIFIFATYVLAQIARAKNKREQVSQGIKFSTLNKSFIVNRKTYSKGELV